MTIRDIAVAFGFVVDRDSERQAENSIKGIKNLATRLLGDIAVVFSVSKLAGFAKDCVAAASWVQEMENKFDVVFGDIRDEVDQWAEGFAEAVGRNKNTIKAYLADQQNLLVGFGMTREEGAKLSEEMTSLALDLASFANTDETAAVEAMTKAVMGEGEAAKTLGAVLNDTTRAETMAAMGLSGTYNSLDQLTKMQVNYQTILRQSPDAIGDCVRSMDSYEARTRQLNSAIAGFKEFIGGQLLPVFAAFIGWMATGVRWLTKTAQGLLMTADGQNRILLLFERMHALVKRLQPAIGRMAQALSGGISKGIGAVIRIRDGLGGIGNILRILTIVAGSFASVMAFSRVTAGVKKLADALKAVDKAMAMAKLKVLAIVAAVVILALIIEDFINFMLGNDSVIGTLFDKAGIGADKARQTIINAWDKIKGFLLGIWDLIEQAAGMWIDTVKGFFERHGQSIRENFERAWGMIKTFLQGVWTFLSQLAAALFGNTEDNIDGSTSRTKDNLLAVWGAILGALSAIWDALYEAGSAIFNAIATVIETVFGWIQAFWDNWGERILSWFKVLWDSLGGILNGFLEIIKGVANFISSVFAGDWKGAWEAVKQVLAGIWEAIVSFLAAAWDTIKMLFEMALAAIKAVWEAAWGAVSSFFQGIWDGIVRFVAGIWDRMTSLITVAINTILGVIRMVLGAVSDVFHGIFDGISGFVGSTFANILSGIITTVTSIREAIVKGFDAAIGFIRGLPGQAVQWGRDFIGGLKDGILSGVQGIVDAVRGIGERIRSFLHFSVPDEGPLTDYEGWMPDFMAGLAEGISANEGAVLDRVKGLAGGIRALMSAATADAATATMGTVNNTTSSVTQNVNIENSYTGGSAEVQRDISKAMKKSATDATTQMARGLAYARG